MTKDPKKSTYIVQQPEPDLYKVIKLTHNSDGITDQVTYEVTKHSCTCKSFEMHGHCKHQDLVFMTDFDIHPIKVREAQAYAKEWVAELQRDWKQVWLPEEPYLRDKDDRIIEINVNVTNPKAETALKPGKWSGKLKDCGIIGVLHVI